MKKILILKDNYNSFEQYYLEKLNMTNINCQFYYKSSSLLRKIMTHKGTKFESICYGSWKKNMSEYDTIIVFDSIHTSNMLKFIHRKCDVRLIFWHWNPIKTDKDKKIINESRDWCEHWTFNPLDVVEYGMKFNTQFFFFQKKMKREKEDKAFFVGTDKGRYNQLLSLATKLEKYGVEVDFHIIDQEKTGRFYQKMYMDYHDVMGNLSRTKIAVEIVQERQTGLTARSLEAMFFGTKLITNNNAIKQCSFYKKENIYILGENEDYFIEFLKMPFVEIDREKLYPYSAQGWIEGFFKE